MNKEHYELPDFLIGNCKPDVYKKWLQRKAQAHVRRDRKRWNKKITISDYKQTIHKAVIESKGKDFYTGEDLRWDLLSKYDNKKSSKGKLEYKKKFGYLPSVDHVNDSKGPIEFKICSWKVNSAKNDLTYEEFVNLCKTVIKYNNKK